MSKFYQNRGKRVLDLLLTIPALVILSPLLVVIAVLVRLSLGAPVLFCQVRPGIYGKPFTLLKFRTMVNAYDAQGSLLSDAERLNSLGRFLRKASLDELPQLLNVLVGDMSLIGPRPLFTEYLSYYTERELMRHSVRPGITGLAQTNGRNRLSWDDRLELDVDYVEHVSFLLDIQILFGTLGKVILRQDIIEAPGTVQGPLWEYRQPRLSCSNEEKAI